MNDQDRIRGLIEEADPIKRLFEVSRDIERNGGVSDVERKALAGVLEDCKRLAEGIEGVLKGGAA